MIINNLFKFSISVSREGYESKEIAKKCLTSECKIIGREKMAFKERKITVKEFLDLAVKGHSFCNLFKFDDWKQYWVESGKFWSKTYPVYKRGLNKGYFKLSFKSDRFFKGSQVIFVDIDKTRYDEINDYIDALSYKPTCVYTSFSDSEEKGGIVSRRFRLVYVFDKVLTPEEFRITSINLYKQIIDDTDEPIDDFCGLSGTQYMNGTKSPEVYFTNYIYSASDIERIVYVEPTKKDIKKIVFNTELVRDIEEKPYRFVVEKWYAKGLRYFFKSEKEFDSWYSTDVDDYYSLFWHSERVKDGQKRRMKLFIRAAVRRLMKETTPDELLYNLYIDRERFFDNSDDVLNVEVLKSKVKGAYKTDLGVVKGLMKDYKKPTFIINPEIKDKREAVGKARTDLTNKKIGEVYDFSKSVIENLKVFRELNIKVSKSRLYQWVKDMDTREKKNIVYDPNLSIRENMKINGCTKYQIEKAKKSYECD